MQGADKKHPFVHTKQVGIAFKESLIPRAVEWFTGEAAPPMYDGEEGDYEEGEWDEE